MTLISPPRPAIPIPSVSPPQASPRSARVLPYKQLIPVNTSNLLVRNVWKSTPHMMSLQFPDNSFAFVRFRTAVAKCVVREHHYWSKVRLWTRPSRRDGSPFFPRHEDQLWWWLYNEQRIIFMLLFN